MEQIRTYRKCHTCNYQGDSVTFKEKTEIASESPVGACMNTNQVCPACGSSDLSTHFTDSGCITPAQESEPIKIDQPRKKVLRTINKVGQVMQYKNGVSIKPMPNRKLAVVDNSDKENDSVLLEFLRADLTEEEKNKLPAGQKGILVKILQISDAGAIGLMVALQDYYSRIKPMNIRLIEKNHDGLRKL